MLWPAIWLRTVLAAFMRHVPFMLYVPLPVLVQGACNVLVIDRVGGLHNILMTFSLGVIFLWHWRRRRFLTWVIAPRNSAQKISRQVLSTYYTRRDKYCIKIL